MKLKSFCLLCPIPLFRFHQHAFVLLIGRILPDQLDVLISEIIAFSTWVPKWVFISFIYLFIYSFISFIYLFIYLLTDSVTWTVYRWRNTLSFRVHAWWWVVSTLGCPQEVRPPYAVYLFHFILFYSIFIHFFYLFISAWPFWGAGSSSSLRR